MRTSVLVTGIIILALGLFVLGGYGATKWADVTGALVTILGVLVAGAGATWRRTSRFAPKP